VGLLQPRQGPHPLPRQEGPLVQLGNLRVTAQQASAS
jgi:hypothetical protein